MTFIVKCAPRLKEWKFCCCSCSLRAASVVLAWFGTMTNVCQLVTCIVCLSQPDFHSEYYGSHKYLASVLGTVVAALILDALLLYGIHSKRPVYMLPYLVLDLISLVIFTVIVVIFSIAAATHHWLYGVLLLSVGSFILAIGAFFWIVLYSYYRQIDEEKNTNSGIVNYTYGIPPNDQVQVSYPEDQKALYPYPNKLAPEVA